MRARNLKPAFFKNELLAEVAPLGRLLFAGLWCAADREGRLEDRPRKLKAEILPYDDCNVDELLGELDQRGFILRYDVGGTRYVQVVNFARHQNPHKAERPSIIPAPCESGACTVQAPFSHGARTVQVPERSEQVSEIPEAVGLIPDSGFLIPDSGVDNISASGGVEASHSSANGFELFWQAWPKSERKTAKAECRKRWQQRGLEALADTVVAHVTAMACTPKWLAGFEPAPLTYLNQRHWEDGLPDVGYTPEQVAVFEAYNSVLGVKDWPEAEMEPFSPERAAAISQFLKFNQKPDFARRYFDHLAENLQARPGYGMDWTLRRDIYLRAREANFSSGGANAQ